MFIIPIIIGILGPLLFLAIVAGVIYLIIQKKRSQDSEVNQKPIHFSDIIANFFSLALLIINVVSVITIIFSIIDKLIPDELKRNSYYEITSGRESLHSAISLLVITIPISIGLSYWMRKQKEKRNETENAVTKFTTGATIIATGITVAGSIFSIIYQFLEGDITNRFLIKVASILVIAAIIFIYYGALYKEVPNKKKYQNIFAITSAIFIITICIYGTIITGTPNQIRKEKYDDSRLSDLSMIQNQVLSYWQNHDMLPEHLIDTIDVLSNVAIPSDPKTGSAYRYEIIKQSENVMGSTTAATFKICAVFESEKKASGNFEQGYENQKDSAPMSLNRYFAGDNSPFWDHGIGEKCFERTIDPKIYKHSQAPAVPVNYKD